MRTRKTIDEWKNRLDKIWFRVFVAFISAYLVMLTASFIEKWSHNLATCYPEETWQYCYLRQAVAVFTPDNIEGFSILTVAFLYVLESQERQQNRIHKAWQVIDNAAAAKVATSYARIAALEYLKENDVSLSGIDVPGADLSLINLSDADLSNANLSRADLTDADFKNANLYKANLRGAKLTNADLSDADLTFANLSFANLSNTDLSRAKLYDAKLGNANLNNAKLDDIEINNRTELDNKWRQIWKIVNEGAMGQDLSYADLSNADLTGSGLSNANLSGTDLSNTNLSNVNLDNANLSDANLTSANLFNADLSSVSLGGANLSGAELHFANLFNANFSSAKNLSIEQIKSARNWQQALYDDEFRSRLGLPLASQHDPEEY